MKKIVVTLLILRNFLLISQVITGNTIASFHSRGFTAIPKYDRFEIGFKLPDSLQTKIDNFLNNGLGGLNPYNPEKIKVFCAYKNVSKNESCLRNGFYYLDFTTQNNTWVEQNTPYKYRIRFAPPSVGYYEATVFLLIDSKLISSTDFKFSVSASLNQGHLGMANKDLKKMQFEHGNLFFGLGEGILWATNNGDFLSPIGGTVMSSPLTHSNHRSYITDLANNNGNLVRIRLDPWSVSVEGKNKSPLPVYPQTLVYSLNNYNHNQMFLWEMDKTLYLCENRGVYIMLNLLGDWMLSNGERYPWLESWRDFPYSTLFSGDDSFTGIHKFFSEDIAKDYYKKQLYYIEARWGYSTQIAMWELINETENVTGYPENTQLRTDLAKWICEMTNYLKGFYPSHNVTTGSSLSIADEISINNYVGCLDIYSGNDYTTDFDTLSNKYASRDYNRFEEASAYYYKDKPFIWGELGITPALTDFGNFTYHNAAWASLFSNGVGVGLNLTDWAKPVSYEHRYSFNALKAYSEKIDFTKILLPCKNDAKQTPSGSDIEYPSSKVLTYWLKTQDNETVYGWSRNTSANWMSQEYPNLPSESDKSTVRSKIGWNGESDFLSFTAKDKKIKVKGLNPRTYYNIKIYGTWDDWGLLEVKKNVLTDKHGLLEFGRQMPYFNESPWYPDYAFIATERSHNKSKSFSNDLDVSIYPNPCKGQVTLDLSETELTWLGVRLFDLDGKVILNQEGVTDITDRIYELNLNVRAGIYIIEITDLKTQERSRQKIVILKD